MAWRACGVASPARPSPGWVWARTRRPLLDLILEPNRVLECVFRGLLRLGEIPAQCEHFRAPPLELVHRVAFRRDLARHLERLVIEGKRVVELVHLLAKLAAAEETEHLLP